MTDIATLLTADRCLQAAQLAADAGTLEKLIDDRLVFTGPAGRLYSKQDDLDLQRSGQQRLSEVNEEELAGLVDGATGVTWFLGRLAGQLMGEAFTARLRYTRTWIHTPDGWRLIAAHVSAAE